jgi:hypothetical protein
VLVVVDLGPEVGDDVAFFSPFTPCASGLIERVHVGVALVGWA